MNNHGTDWIDELVKNMPVEDSPLNNINLHSMLTRIRSDYDRSYDKNNVYQFIKDALHVLCRYLPSEQKLVVSSSCGFGEESYVPHVAAIDRRISDNIKDGLSIGYIFPSREVYATHENKILLCIILGVSKERPYQRYANMLAKEFAAKMFSSGPYGTKIGRATSSHYDKAIVFYKEYLLETLPSNDALISDLLNMYEKYQEIIQSGKYQFKTVGWKGL